MFEYLFGILPQTNMLVPFRLGHKSALYYLKMRLNINSVVHRHLHPKSPTVLGANVCWFIITVIPTKSFQSSEIQDKLKSTGKTIEMLRTTVSELYFFPSLLIHVLKQMRV
jgi:hypothetical protein